MIAYPAYHGVEDYEPAREILEEILDTVYRFEGTEVKYNLLQYLEGETSLWWASKELARGKLLSDYVGKNEKTKIVINNIFYNYLRYANLLNKGQDNLEKSP